MTKGAKAKREARVRQERTGETYSTARQRTLAKSIHEEAKGSPWICMSCGKPIFGDEGVIQIINSSPALGKVGAFPRRCSNDQDLIASPNVEFIVHHYGECVMYPDAEDGYSFRSDRAATLQQWCAWTYQVQEKPWMSRGDLMRFLRFWFDNRSENLSE
ncbi:hypothetical protein L6R46_00045 [Myxococcota bacterium]|nr:hypothetical protein [Myxococcota bacterium]